MSDPITSAPCPGDHRRRHALQRGGLARGALPTHRRHTRGAGATLRDHLRRRRLDRRDIRRAGRAPRGRPTRPRSPLQTQFRPASGDARRVRPSPRRDHRHDGRRSPEHARGHPEARRGGRRRADVASGRRVARRDSWGRTLPSRLINGMLRRFTGRDLRLRLRLQRVPARAVTPMLGAIGKQKFTKALILSGGASVVEVDVPRGTAGLLALLATSPDEARAPRARGLLAAADPVGRRRRSASSARCRALLGVYGLVYWIGENDFPARSSGARRPLRARRAGLHPRARRRVSGQNPARRGRSAAVHDRTGAGNERAAKRVLVTGGAGFISSNVVRHLLEATTYEVVSLDALTYAGNLENLADVMSHERLSFVQGDIRDAELVRDVVAGVDVIVNAAAESHVEKSILEGASEFVTTNVEGTQILLDAIRQTPVERFILISSSEVYGTAEADPMDEDHPLNPRSPYAATKAGADRLAYAYYVTYGLPIVIVRPFNNYGPRQHPEKVIPRFITRRSRTSRSPCTATATRDGTGSTSTTTQKRSRRDRGRFDAVPGEVINVATGVDISVPEIADLVPRRSASRVAEGARRGAAGPGRPAHRLDGQGCPRARLGGPDTVRGGARAHRRLVPRE